MWRFRTEARDVGSLARAGYFDTPHGRVVTPLFMPVGTHATVKGLLPTELEAAGAQIVLANAYHLARQPGARVVAALGGLHALMGWRGPILTDSGGFQVFSLGRSPGRHASLVERVDEEGVRLRVPGAGLLRMTPETSMEEQRLLGADVVMAFDECLPDDVDERRARESMERTHRWLVRCRESWSRDARSSQGAPQALFGIAQGGVYPALRRESAAFVASLDLPGFAVGGESIGFSKATTGAVLDWIADLVPHDRPRYAMGVGEPDDFFDVVSRGIDMFDCVLPTRMARNGTVFTRHGRLRLLAREAADDGRPIDDECGCATCRVFSRAYLRHLFKAREPLGPQLASVHNADFCCKLVLRIRESILRGTFQELRRGFLGTYRAGAGEPDTRGA